jgi:hypothetical protein
MTWIEIHGEIFSNRKIITAATMLTGGDVHALVGHLARLWTWSLDNAEDGDLSYLSDRDIALAAGWRGQPARFVGALRSVHLLDSSGMIHNWEEYAGKLIERRRRDRQRKRIERAELKERSANVPDATRAAPEGPLDPGADVRVHRT